MDETAFISEPRLPFPTRVIPAKWGSVEEYDIPNGEKTAVLDVLYPFDPVPGLDEMKKSRVYLYLKKTMTP